MSRLKIFSRRFMLLVFFVAIAIATIGQHFLITPLIPVNQSAVIYQLQPGTTLRQLATDLHKRGWLSYPNLLVLLGRLQQYDRQLQSGEYLFEPGIRPKALLEKISEGDVIQHSVTLLEGWTFKQFLQALAAEKALQQKHSSAQLAALVQPAEGWFFPNTYRFPRGTTDMAILKKAHVLMKEKLMVAWQARAQGLFYKKPYEALIVASLIEKETAVAKERPLIASVILTRLQKKMPLQIDAAVIYGLGDQFNGDITKKDLRRKTPYNTYRNRGLPPTPIAMPSLASIIAALHPAKTEYLYFVAKGDRSHYFSRTLKEHNAAVRKYQLSPHNDGREEKQS